MKNQNKITDLDVNFDSELCADGVEQKFMICLMNFLKYTGQKLQKIGW